MHSPSTPVLMTDVTISGSLYQKSPLDTLVGKSSRRAQTTTRLQPVSAPNQHHGRFQNVNHNPHSPLLHTRFRTSASTASSSFIDLRDGDGNAASVEAGQGQHSYWNGDDDSVYSRMSAAQSAPAPDTPGFAYVIDAVENQSRTPPRSPTPSSVFEPDRQSWASYGSGSTVRMNLSAQPTRDTWRSSAEGADPFSFRQYESPTRVVPMVVVSSPTATISNPSLNESPDVSSQSITSRPSVTQYSISNFSRPLRYPPVQDAQSKWEVLGRNSSPEQQPRQELSPRRNQALHSNNWQQDKNSYDALSHPASPSTSSVPLNLGSEEPGSSAMIRSAVANTAHSTLSDPIPSGITRSTSPVVFPNPSNQPIRLPNSPPSPRPTSRASLYSAYSFYQLDDGSRTPSPSSPNFQQPYTSGGKPALAPFTNEPLSRSRPSPSPVQPSPSVRTPDDYLILGIQHHEANRLSESASCFERAATLDGGCGIGMLMWGLTLRHAWGTPKDEKAAFRWLRRAAEAAVGDLEAARSGIDQRAVKVLFISSPLVINY